ncbi:MAG: DNA-processing protein DprA [Weeksellaceae bacterium]|nr:DNA-processing protein DprA [Weeksellaceae bacterium]
MKPDLLHLLALTFIPGLGTATQRKIIKIARPDELWSFSQKELHQIFRKKPEHVDAFSSDKYLEIAEKEIEYCQANGIDILSYLSNDYPEKLRDAIDAPLILFRKGNYDFERKLHIGVVGTRKMTAYGKEFIEQFVEDLSEQNMAFVSGLAFGCDVTAHRMAVKCRIPNVAVLATGLNRVSPASHAPVAEKIIENGALISEYASFHKPESMNFVLRNRIIAGLCDAVIIVESAERGGALFTAAYANSYNREVFALPGRVGDKFSLGCNQLIQTNQAYMIRNSNDLLDYFNLRNRPKPKQTTLFVELEDDEQKIYDHLKAKGRQQIDKLALDLKIPIYQLNTTLLNLELKGVVKPLTGKFFELE